MMREPFYRAMADSSGLVEKLCAGNYLTALEFVVTITEKEKFFQQLSHQGSPSFERDRRANVNLAESNEKTVTNDPICFNWKESGTCKFGESCRFKHTGIQPNKNGVSQPSKEGAKVLSQSGESKGKACVNCGKSGHKSKSCN